MEEFVNQCEEDDDEIEEFCRTDIWTSLPALVAAYLVSVVAFAVIKHLFNNNGWKSEYWGYSDVPAALSFVIVIASYLVIFMSMINKKNELGFNKRDVVYHYIAKSISSYQDEAYEDIGKYIDKANDYLESNSLHIAHPKVQESFETFASYLENAESEREKKLIIDGFFKNTLDNITSSILWDESSEFELVFEEDVVGESSTPSGVAFVIDTVSNFLTKRRLRYATPLLVLALASISFVFIGQKYAIVVLTGYPVVESLIGVKSRKEDDE